MKVLLNRFDDPKLSKQIFVGKGDRVYAANSAEEYGFIPGNSYEILGISQGSYLLMQNEDGATDEYSVEYFQKHEPIL